MKLYTYLRCRHFVESDENKKLAQQAQRMAWELLKENANFNGKYLTVEELWRELLRRAKALDND